MAKIHVSGKIAKLHSGDAEAIYTGRFIDILELPKIEDLGIYCNNNDDCSRKLLKTYDILVRYLKQNFHRDALENVYKSFPKINSKYIHIILHEYVHWSMLSGTKTAAIIEQISWKERIDNMYFTYLYYNKINLGRIVNRNFARIDKADVIGEGLDENETSKILKEVKNLIDDFSKDKKSLYSFLHVIKNFKILATIGSIISVIIEPATWSIVENQDYFNKYLNAYFGDSEVRKKYATSIYKECLEIINNKNNAHREIIDKVRKSLNSIDIISEIIKMDNNSNDEDYLEKILNSLYNNFVYSKENSAQLNLSFNKDILPGLILAYSKEPFGKEKIDLITNTIANDWNVLNYVIKSIFKLKAELSADNLPSICGNMIYHGQIIGGCYNPDIGITGRKVVKRPFGSFEELVGNITLSLKPSLLLAFYYSYSYNDYYTIISKISERLKYDNLDFTKVAIDEVSNLNINPNEMQDIFNFYEEYMEKENLEEASKSISAFLIYWAYLTLRLGNKNPLRSLGSRHGIFLF
ncbi:hypothetical protein [Saccharolobus islandicus]|nr:hypothetical protein [Sulfolobus islandicus]